MANEGFEIVKNLLRKYNKNSVMANVVRVYWERGYTSWSNFPREYFFMLNKETGEKVRIYYNGRAVEG
jgi:hypothetical protein